MAAALGLDRYRSELSRKGLAEPAELAGLSQVVPGTTEAPLTHLVQRIQPEMEFTAAKADAPYRDGQHDGMRFDREAILRILTGQYEHEQMVIEREGKESA